MATLSTGAYGFSGAEEVLILDNEVYDYGNDYDNTTGIFTTPVTGKQGYIKCGNI